MTSWLERYQRHIIIALAALLAAAVVYLLIEQRDGPPALEIRFDTTPTAGGPIEVYITGAVAQPGVYEMLDGDRVIDLLYEAGGGAPDANLEAVNLAQRLRDEDRVVVPRLGAPASDVAGVATNPVNLNTATAGDLLALPGIGETYSGRIIESRTADGPFASTDDLVLRQLVPQATYEQIRDLITAP